MSTVVHTMSAAGDVQYTRGLSREREDMSTPRDIVYLGAYHDECGGYHQYTGGIRYTRGNIIISILGDVQYTWGIMSTLWPNTKMHVGGGVI